MLTVYWPVKGYDFISFDDPTYVSDNPHVAEGLTAPAVAWAFGDSHAGYWIPLTWLSYMADVQLAGNSPGVHHAANVLFHLLTAWLLFAFLQRATRHTGRSLFVAALFACHPLHVESVAWITERKDVLSGLFMMLTLCAYLAYARRPSVRRYVPVAVAFACALMAKPMVVTLPVVLLLVDWWPLGRYDATPRMRLLIEKLPLFGLSLASGAITFAAQRAGGAVSDTTTVGPLLRVTTALVAYATYVAKAIWPRNLAIFYPYPSSPNVVGAAAALLALFGICALVAKWRRKHPYLAVGWLWYVVMLFPVAGFLQVGMQAMADRFTYLPSIGLFIAVAWGVTPLLRQRTSLLAAIAALLVTVYAVRARGQVETWANDETLWRHAISVVPDNFLAHNSLGRLLYSQGRTGEAAEHFAECVRLAPAFADGRHNLGLVLQQQGRLDEAIAQYREEVRLKPTAEALTALAAALAQQGATDAALFVAQQAVNEKPQLAEAHYNLGLMLLSAGRVGEAVPHLREARRLKPDLAAIHIALASALQQKGDIEDALAEYNEALRLDERSAAAHHGLAGVLATQGKAAQSLKEYGEAVTLDATRPDFQNDLGFALAAQGRLSDAIPRFAEAVRLAPNFAVAHRHLGLALAATGHPAEAAEHLTRALSLNPADGGAKQALATLQRRR